MLARRDHPAAELSRKLTGKGYDPALVGELVGRLRAEKLVDDRRYVENFINAHAARGQGPIRVHAELRRAGVPDELIDAGVEAYGDWLEYLAKARQKKFGAELPSDYADRQRQARFLSYRGFTSNQIRLALGFDTELEGDP
jgi:regulatory protein